MSSVVSFAPFAGFRPAAFAFLRELAETQNRDWFEAHKADYEAQVRGPMGALVGELSAALEEREIPLRGDPKRSVFRIHRDVRFSKNKQLYKTHCGATLTRDGAKLSAGLLYIHIDPAGSFAAAGFYRPEPPTLEAIRTAIAEDGAAFRAVLAALARAGLALGPDETALKRTPRGFEHVAEPDLIEALRRKNFIVRQPLSQRAVGRASLVQDLARFAEAAAPLLRFGWEAIV